MTESLRSPANSLRSLAASYDDARGPVAKLPSSEMCVGRIVGENSPVGADHRVPGGKGVVVEGGGSRSWEGLEAASRL